MKATFSSLCIVLIFIAYTFATTGCKETGATTPGSQTPPTTPPAGDNSGENDANNQGGKWTNTCGSIPNVVGGTFCVYENSPNPQQTLWFFHGLGDSPLIWEQNSPKYSSYVELKNGLGPTKVVMVSFGLSWLLTGYGDRTLEPLDATMDIFISQSMPFFERNFNLPKPYIIAGHSMGGFNTASLCAAYPDKWSKCILLNAMLPTCDPYGLIPTCNPGPGLVVKYNFTKETWKTHQPLKLLANTKTLPKSFVTTCKDDEWGLIKGPKTWYDQAIRQGFDSTYLPIISACDHAHWPAQAVLDFINKN